MSLPACVRVAMEREEFQSRLGRIAAFNGLVLEAEGPDAALGEVCEVLTAGEGSPVLAQVVGFRKERVLLMPYGDLSGLSARSQVRARGRLLDVPVGPGLLGRVIDAFCSPIDGKGDPNLTERYPLQSEPNNPLNRPAIDEIMETGIRTIDALLTLGRGQRIGVFAGSGVGKSTLLGMLARHVEAEVVVLCLVGERGREVGDFLRDALGEDGLKRSVVVAATADQPALVRTHAVHTAHAIAEYFRDQGKSILLVVDSITRFAMAQREIGLAIGEPPTFRGYTPSVFGWLPRIAERCGRHANGDITAVYSVLVEGDDMNDPVADHMRAILDGHVVLSRDLASRGHLPAIDVLHSTSRLLGSLAGADELETVAEVRRLLAVFEGSRDMIELGAHQPGANPALDRAIALKPHIDQVLCQRPTVSSPRSAAMVALRLAIGATRD
jgi:flagellum-specific ATP synthase